MTGNSAGKGTYRIEEQEFPAPVTDWDPQPLGSLLNGFVVHSSYYTHKWTWPGGILESDYMEALLAKFQDQQDTGVQLTLLETDPYDASGACETYGTVEYTDFLIKEVTPTRREFPHYGDVTVTFEVYVP
jgi:hypothetical protein